MPEDELPVHVVMLHTVGGNRGVKIFDGDYRKTMVVHSAYVSL